ncbi:MAG: aminotransferase class I/II-fold pyridoxal phosphate-dependent enzyme [Kiritimatiellae bacterium]|nr:aminotransferase class I/II-fold pyridoxal phosphate-dependent enzyme [Kiritimatiellia bacterium]
MNKLAIALNRTLGPAAGFLSEAGRRMYFPYEGILGQGGEAKGCDVNATIGMAFEEDSSPLVMKCFGRNLSLDKRAFLYAGSFGLPALRAHWKEMELKKNRSLAGVEFSVPVVTNALTHGLRITAELFAGRNDELVVPDLFWDNYELIFREAVGCRVRHFNTFRRGAFDVGAMKSALESGGGKKILLLNFPNNPTGYTATFDDSKKIVAAVKAVAAAGRRVVVVLDDAYFGLVYEKGVHAESLFAEFASLDGNVLAVKLDGTTKEDYVWGLRVGFISFAFKGATAEQLRALEAKAAGNVRSSISNASSVGQHLALAAYADPGYKAQKREKFQVLKGRYLEIKRILGSHPEYARAFEPMPFNSGYFMCVKPRGVDAETLRRHLMAKYSIGTIELCGLIRIAFSAVPKRRLEGLFADIAAAVEELRSAGGHEKTKKAKPK